MSRSAGWPARCKLSIGRRLLTLTEALQSAINARFVGLTFSCRGYGVNGLMLYHVSGINGTVAPTAYAYVAVN